MLDLAPIVQKGVEALAPELFKAALKSASRSFQELRPYTVLNFEDNFAISFQRCTKIKTIVNGDVPIELLNSYVNLSFSCHNKTVDDYDLIDTIWEKRNIVISGPAGCGKSMFMKYLWISCFVQSRGKIRLFIELRQLNNIEVDDFIGFLFHSCAFKQQKNAKDLFDKAIAEGQFFFILDGFDELFQSKADMVEREILKLRELGKNIVVVSTRPDERFGGWLSFMTYRVNPLTKQQVVLLIERIDFDQIIKKNFITQIKSKLYDKHKDFISRPLLATMMLLTYNSFAEIPNRIHVFYDQAFDTLFSRHDATKEAFKRKRHTDLAIYEFKKLFGNLCLVTYVEQETEFTESTIREYIIRAGKIARIEFDHDLFLKDLMNSVCVIQRDGLSIVFSHRSFQEYFCAYAFLRLARDEAKAVAIRLSSRRGDSVIPMLFEMNRSFLEDVYVVPMIEKTEQFLDKIESRTSVVDIAEYLGCTIVVQTMIVQRSRKLRPANRAWIHISQGNEYFNFVYWLSVLYEKMNSDVAGAVFAINPFMNSLSTVEQKEIASIISVPKEDTEEGFALLFMGRNILDSVQFNPLREGATRPTRIRRKPEDAAKVGAWIEKTKLGNELLAKTVSAKQIIKELIAERQVEKDQVISLLSESDKRTQGI